MVLEDVMVDELTAARLRKMIRYEFWGAKLATSNPTGMFASRSIFQAHRLAWIYMTGEWPEEQIDHINRMRSDNRFCNLREATASQNVRNSARKERPPPLGVCVEKRWPTVFKARIKINGKHRHLGTFQTADDASEAYLHAARLHCGEFVRT
jgi:hypothetical protein